MECSGVSVPTPYRGLGGARNAVVRGLGQSGDRNSRAGAFGPLGKMFAYAAETERLCDLYFFKKSYFFIELLM